jgi:arylsulfatase A-like enzyme
MDRPLPRQAPRAARRRSAAGRKGAALAVTALCLSCTAAPPADRPAVTGDETVPVTLGVETRPARKDGPSNEWRLGMVLPRGHLVVALGTEGRAARKLITTFESGSGRRQWTHEIAAGGGPGWEEWTLAVPPELADVEGEITLQVKPSGSPRPAIARPVPVPSQPSRRNVILISIDTLRADRLGCYGNPRLPSPAIDRLAGSGVLCWSTVAPSNWTLPSHYSMMTSLYPSVHGVHPDRAAFGGFRRPTHVAGVRGSGREETLAERLSELGYFTAAITEDGWVHPEFGFDQGFASYVADTSGSLAATRTRTLEWLSEHADLPFFLFVHTYQPHQPYDMPPPYDTMFLDRSHVGYALPGSTVPVELLEDFQPGFFEPMRADLDAFFSLYDAEVRYVDDFVADVARTLEQEGIDDRTVVVLTSDHGEEIFEHGRFSHGDALYDEVMRVPLIVWGAGIPAGVVIEEPVTLLDILPTVVEIAGGEVEGPVQGLSLVARFGGPLPGLEHRTLFAEGYGKDSLPMYCMWRGAHKYITGASPGRGELYDLSRDPGERHELSAASPATAADLRSAIEAWHRESLDLGQRFESGERVLDEDVVDRLRTLGYLD